MPGLTCVMQSLATAHKHTTTHANTTVHVTSATYQCARWQTRVLSSLLYLFFFNYIIGFEVVMSALHHSFEDVIYTCDVSIVVHGRDGESEVICSVT